MLQVCLPTTVNPHFLARVLAFAATAPVRALADIGDVDGNVLLGAGEPLDAEAGERLAGARLRKPLEACLATDAPITNSAIIETATRLIDDCVPVGRVLRATSSCGMSARGLLAQIEFGEAMRLLFTLSCRDSTHGLEHNVMVALLAICMAKKLHLSDDDQLSAGIAGLLHDVGELHVAPHWLAPGIGLRAHEWAHVVVHPRIGQLMVNELEGFPLAVGRAIAEHHERFNGTGYPRQTAGNHISPCGQAVGVAEMVAGLLGHPRPLERAELALKILPGEYAPDLVSAISGVLRKEPRATSWPAPGDDDGECVERLFLRLSAAVDAGQRLLDQWEARPGTVSELLRRATQRTRAIQRAFISTGLDGWLQESHGMESAGGAVRFERSVATREIQWRLRDIARDLALHTGPDNRAVFSSLIALLDEQGDAADLDAATPSARHPSASFADSQQDAS